MALQTMKPGSELIWEFRYIFVVERIHVVRAPLLRRSHDWLYISSMVLMLLSFGTVAINAYLTPIIEMNPSNGRCHMGIPGRASIPFMSVDIAVNTALTGIFIYLLHPIAKLGSPPGGSRGLRPRTFYTTPGTMVIEHTEEYETAAQESIRFLLRKSLIGSMLIMLPTIANMVQFYITEGRELALICLTLCTVDGMTSYRLLKL